MTDERRQDYPKISEDMGYLKSEVNNISKITTGIAETLSAHVKSDDKKFAALDLSRTKLIYLMIGVGTGQVVLSKGIDGLVSVVSAIAKGI